MSNFTKEQLYAIYEKFLPSFTELANEAIKNAIHIEVEVSPKGAIQVTSREYFSDDSRDYVKIFEIIQGKDIVSDLSKTLILREKKQTEGKQNG